MRCKQQIALGCSSGLFILSVVLISLYFSCMNVCLYRSASYAAPVWTAAVGFVLAIFGFVVSRKKLQDVWEKVFSTVCVVCMICTLVCIYLALAALINEMKFKAVNPHYMKALVLWIAMCGAAGIMFGLATAETCGYLCCQHGDQNADTGATEIATAWPSSGQNRPADFIRDRPPAYAPSTPVAEPAINNGSSDNASILAPTAPPLFLSQTLLREQGMSMAPSADRRSFSANLMDSLLEENPLPDSIHEYHEMPTFSSEVRGSAERIDVNEDNTNSTTESNENNAGTAAVAETEAVDNTEDGPHNEITEVV